GRSFPLSVVLTAALQTEGMQKRQGKGNPFHGNGFHERRPNCGSTNGGNAETAGKGKTNPAGWFSMRALGAQRGLLAAASALDYFWLIPAKAGIKRGFRPLRRATQGAALRTRKPFEKGLSETFCRGAVLFGGFGYISFPPAVFVPFSYAFFLPYDK